MFLNGIDGCTILNPFQVTEDIQFNSLSQCQFLDDSLSPPVVKQSNSRRHILVFQHDNYFSPAEYDAH